LKKPSKTAAELKVELEDICDWPTDVMDSVQANGGNWKVVVMQEGSLDDADRREWPNSLRAEYDLKSRPHSTNSFCQW
jgi:hypothetical protein